MEKTAFPNAPAAHPACGKVNELLGRVGDKWTVLVIVGLRERPRRFNDLKRLTVGISQQMLTRTLRALERDGMVTRTVHPTVPPQVEYALSDLGRSLSEPVFVLGSWVVNNMDAIESNRRAFDQSQVSGRIHAAL